MAEFFNDAVRESHLAALEREREGYKARQKAYQAKGDTAGAKLMGSRMKQVDDQLERLGTEPSPVEETVEETEAETENKGGGGSQK